MNNSSIQKKVAPRLTMMLLLITSVFIGCATTRTGKTGDAAARTVWSLGEQYVAIEKREAAAGAPTTGKAVATDISTGRLHGALESIEVHTPGDGKDIPLFNDPELKILSEQISKALAAAGPDEDVTFTIIGDYPTSLGFFKERKVTTGIVFCENGKLNIIFGEVLRDVNEKEDRRLHPYLHASRNAAASLASVLSPRPGHEKFEKKRPDWVVFPMAAPAVPVAIPIDSPTGTSGNSLPPAGHPAAKLPAATRSIEERLRTLNELQSKKLLTEEEYRAKRREILNDL